MGDPRAPGRRLDGLPRSVGVALPSAGPNLVVGGTADDLWLSGFRGTGTVVELPDADHGLEAADWQTSFRNHERALLAVQRFVTALPE